VPRAWFTSDTTRVDHREAVRHRTWPRRGALNQTVHAVFDESQVFRIDHFLGKESVDNILAFRFAETGSTNRSGTAITSATCRSTCRKR